MGCIHSSNKRKYRETRNIFTQTQCDNNEQLHKVIQNETVKKIYVKYDDLVIKDEFYRGTISQVFNGTLKTNSGIIDVACKKIKWDDIQKYNIFCYILKEVLIGMSLTSDFIVKHYGITNDNDSIYIVTEKYGEINLSELISVRNPPHNILCNIASQILHIILWLHSKNIVHRDVKLSNFLISNGIVKICDFGAATTKKTRLMSLCGTLSHMAPEIAYSNEYDFRVDYWAFGFVLVELFGSGVTDIKSLNKMAYSCPDVKYILCSSITNTIILDICSYILNNYKLHKCIDMNSVLIKLDEESHMTCCDMFNLSPLISSNVSQMTHNIKNNGDETKSSFDIILTFNHIMEIEIEISQSAIVLNDSVDKLRYTISSDDIDILSSRLTT